jgi:hypothetical protein
MELSATYNRSGAHIFHYVAHVKQINYDQRQLSRSAPLGAIFRMYSVNTGT